MKTDKSSSVLRNETPLHRKPQQGILPWQSCCNTLQFPLNLPSAFTPVPGFTRCFFPPTGEQKYLKIIFPRYVCVHFSQLNIVCFFYFAFGFSFFPPAISVLPHVSVKDLVLRWAHLLARPRVMLSARTPKHPTSFLRRISLAGWFPPFVCLIHSFSFSHIICPFKNDGKLCCPNRLLFQDGCC